MERSMLPSLAPPQPGAEKSPSPFIEGTKIQFAWDSTSIGYLKTCPRLYYYIMIAGYGEGDESIHLRFGIEYHHSLEHYDRLKTDGANHEDALREVVRSLHERTWNWETDPTTKAGKYKHKTSLMRSVIWYLEKYKDDPAKTVILDNGKPAVELSFRFELPWGPSSEQETKLVCTNGHDRCEGGPFEGCPYCETRPVQKYLLSGHLDRVVEFNHALFVMDRKTTQTTLSEYYYAQYDMSGQMTLYTLAGKTVLHSPIRGVCIDAAQLLIDETKFGRSFTYRSPDQIDEWLENLSLWLSMAENYAAAEFWPMNDTACDKFGGCKFRGICSKSPQVRDKFLNSQFKQLAEEDRWNPLKPR